MKVIYTRGYGDNKKVLLEAEQDVIPRREDAVYLPAWQSGFVGGVKWHYMDEQGFELEEPYVELDVQGQ